MTTDAELYDAILRDEEELRFQRFDLDDAWELGSLLVGTARERNLPIGIGIQLGRQRAFHAALPGSSTNNNAWVGRKLNVVAFYDHASYAVGALYRMQGKDFASQSGLDPRKYSPYGGAFPLRIGQTLVGAVGVSGLPQEDDHALVVEMLREYRHVIAT
jgi:uncharacterized protein (UPF0303 family)